MTIVRVTAAVSASWLPIPRAFDSAIEWMVAMPRESVFVLACPDGAEIAMSRDALLVGAVFTGDLAKAVVDWCSL